MTARDDEDRKAFEKVRIAIHFPTFTGLQVAHMFWHAALAYAQQKHDAEMVSLVKFVAKEETAREWDDVAAESTVAAFRAQQQKGTRR